MSRVAVSVLPFHSGDSNATGHGGHLAGRDLRGADLSGQHLAGMDLSGRELQGANLQGADLRGAVLYGAQLQGACLVGAQLEGADLNDVHAAGANFGHANLRGATLFSADLSEATLSSADLHGADLRGAQLQGARLREACLDEADLTRAVMCGADLTRTQTRGASFQNVDLKRAHMRELRDYQRAHWIGCDIRDVDFTGAYGLRRHIIDENYLFEFRSRGAWSRVVFYVWSISSDCGRSASRWFALNAVIALLFAAAYCYVDIDYGQRPTALSPVYFSFVTITTLGYGDITPISASAQALTILEVLLGYVGMGGLLSILATKLARRGD